MKYDLAAMTKRVRRTRRDVIALRPIKAPGTFASDLFASTYAPVVKVWQEAIPEIMEEYERTLGQMTTDAPADVSVRVDLAEARAQSVFVAIAVTLERWVYRIELWHRRRWVANVLSATNVSLDTLIGPADVRETIQVALARNVGLVKSVSDGTRRRIEAAVFNGFTTRKPSREIAKELREAVGIERRRALRIASNETTTLAAELNQERRRQAGIDTWQWIHSSKRHPRPEHEARDGFLYSENAERHGKEYQGKRIRKSPQRDDWPGVPIYCGCTSRAVLILE